MSDEIVDGATSSGEVVPTIASVDLETGESSAFVESEVANETREITHAVASEPTRTIGNPASRSRLDRMRGPLLIALVVVLFMALGLGTAYSKVQFDQRDATIADYRATTDNLTASTKQLQAQVADLNGQRDGLVFERNTIQSQRDAVTRERDMLKAQVADLQKQTSDLQATVADEDRQLTQAREEGSRQQSRAQNAEAVGSVLTQVVQLDNEIHQEYVKFLDEINNMNKSYGHGDLVAGNYYYQQALGTANRLDSLFNQRDTLLAQLQ